MQCAIEHMQDLSSNDFHHMQLCFTACRKRNVDLGGILNCRSCTMTAKRPRRCRLSGLRASRRHSLCDHPATMTTVSDPSLLPEHGCIASKHRSSPLMVAAPSLCLHALYRMPFHVYQLLTEGWRTAKCEAGCVCGIAEPFHS